MNLFRELDESETEEFRQWARENDTPAHRAKGGIYHPAVRGEWEKIDAEKAAG